MSRLLERGEPIGELAGPEHPHAAIDGVLVRPAGPERPGAHSSGGRA
ncbi:MAG: hypothetical protein M3276_00170 [Actinomycetota bacterium]|nr:hypothetical protein [Actinomycetota bacterium]